MNEVVVPVTVTDEKGRFVSDLEQADFKIFDQGKEQTIRYFNRERNQRVVVGFLVDLSNQSRGQWKSLQEATIELVLNLLPGDKKYAGYLIGFGNEAELMVNTTSDADPIVERLRKVSPSGGSAFYDAIYMACTSRKLVDGEPVDPRRVIVVIGDGHDNASTHTLDQVIELAQRYQVTINAMSTDAYGLTSDAGKNLVRMTEETGGRIEYPLMNVYKDVSGSSRSLPMREITRSRWGPVGIPPPFWDRFTDPSPISRAKSRCSMFFVTCPTRRMSRGSSVRSR